MATQKPISTISYNSKSFLIEKLNTWYNSRIIQAYQVIFHTGEDGDKNHAHLRIEPNKRIDPMELTELLKEYEPGKEKPLGVRPWRPSKEEDWYLYVVHDEEYLKFKYGGGDKGEKLPYDFHDILVSPDYDLEVAFVRAKASQRHSQANIVTRLKDGESPTTLLSQGENPFVVSNIVHLLQGNDYSNLQARFMEIDKENKMLIRAIQRKGLKISPIKDGKLKGEFELIDDPFGGDTNV